MRWEVLGIAFLLGCGGSGKPTGTEGGHCYPNNTCNSGLVCLSNFCVEPPPDGDVKTGNDSTIWDTETCIPNCSGKECGDENGCQGICTGCPPDLVCDDIQGICQCPGTWCGNNCCKHGQSCGSDDTCQLVCPIHCDGKECGDDGCGGSCGECLPGKTCSSGLCTTTEGQGDCIDIGDCVSENSCSGQSCIDECVSLGSSESQTQYNSLLTCMDDECSQYYRTGQIQQTTYCIYTKCKIHNQSCVHTGTLSCYEIAMCPLDCGEDTECALNCADKGTYEAATLFYALVACVEELCPQDPDCAMTSCYGPTNACFTN